MSQRVFNDLPSGTRFTFRGKQFTKIAMSMAEDESRNGNIFHAATPVELEEPGSTQEAAADKQA